MTFEVTVTKRGGEPIPMALVTCNDETTGATFSRGTDGNGYANVDMKGTPTDGRPITLSVLAGGYLNAIQYPIMTPADQQIPIVLASFNKPFQAAPRAWNGVNICGVRFYGLPAVPGMEGAPPGLFLSWFYDRYSDDWRGTIRATMRELGKTHWLLSWPDSRAQGATPESFLATCRELIADGFLPCVMLASKDFDPRDVSAIVDGWADVLPRLVGVVPMFCVGWELSLWLSPTQVQQLIDVLAAAVQSQPGTRTYVHFQEGYGAFQQPGHFFCDFWNANVGKLTGVLHQRILASTHDEYRFGSGGLTDILIRFAGGAGCSPDDGTGHPFDCVALEITAMQQFNNQMSEHDGDAWAAWARDTPPVTGPFGFVSVMGTGN
jgi:hypothetical protein